MRSPRPVSLDELRRRLERIHGPRRGRLAYELALLASVAACLEGATRRRSRLADHFAECWEAEDRRAWSIETRRRPPWLVETWHAQAAMAAAMAAETEWFQLLEGLLPHAGAAVDELKQRAPRAVVVFGDDGEARTLFHVERGEIV